MTDDDYHFVIIIIIILSLFNIILSFSLRFCIRTAFCLCIVRFFLGQIGCSNEKKKNLIINGIVETQFKLSFLTLLTGGKKCLEKPLQRE